jgi:alkanesulfonate monooxygenase SsuD/methylene tetrahydromethanopterin reductase-like flavin-dependent oxidoreductase (luciferase family)
MKVGVTTFVTDEGIRPAPLAKALEERGFDLLLVHDHSHVPVARETPFPGGGELPGMYYRTLDPFVALTAAATVTDNLLLGTGVALLVERDVIHTAKQVASLDLVSGGRVIFGVGTGWIRRLSTPGTAGAQPTTRRAVHQSRPRIGSASGAREGGGWKGSAKYWVSCVTRPSVNSMMLTEWVVAPS